MVKSYDTITISNVNEQRKDVQNLVEEISDSYNLHNYFGIFTVVVDQVLDLIQNNSSDVCSKVTFTFEQCVGGVCFVFNSQDTLFNKDVELIRMLSNECNVLEDGKAIELIFFVEGIDNSELTSRQNSFKEYFNCKKEARKLSLSKNKEKAL